MCVTVAKAGDRIGASFKWFACAATTEPAKSILSQFGQAKIKLNLLENGSCVVRTVRSCDEREPTTVGVDCEILNASGPERGLEVTFGLGILHALATHAKLSPQQTAASLLVFLKKVKNAHQLFALLLYYVSINPHRLVLHAQSVSAKDKADMQLFLNENASVVDVGGIFASFARHGPSEENPLEISRWATWLVKQTFLELSYDGRAS